MYCILEKKNPFLSKEVKLVATIFSVCLTGHSIFLILSWSLVVVINRIKRSWSNLHRTSSVDETRRRSNNLNADSLCYHNCLLALCQVTHHHTGCLFKVLKTVCSLDKDLISITFGAKATRFSSWIGIYHIRFRWANDKIQPRCPFFVPISLICYTSRTNKPVERA